MTSYSRMMWGCMNSRRILISRRTAQECAQHQGKQERGENMWDCMSSRKILDLSSSYTGVREHTRGSRRERGEHMGFRERPQHL